MKAVVITEPGNASVLQVKEVADPAPVRGEVLVRVHATAVNRADILQRAGHYPAPPGCVPDIPGLEFAGEVDTVGDGVRDWKKGDRVFGLTPGGSYAQYVVTHERCLSRIPDNLSYVEAAAIPEAAITAYDAMVSQGDLRSGQFVLISAAASGVGTAAIQIARAIGAVPLGTTRSREKQERLKGLGLEHAIVVEKNGGYAEKVKEITGGGGVDLVIELVGGSYMNENLNCVRVQGKIIVVGLLAGRSCEFNLQLLLSRRIMVRGTTLRARPLEEKIMVAQRFSRQVVPLIERRLVTPVIDRQFSLEEAGAAHEFVEGNTSFGKAVLVVT